MDPQNYFTKIQKLQKDLLEFISYETNEEEKFQNLINIFDDMNIHQNQYDLKLLLNLIINIANNHYRSNNFFNKIEKIIDLFKDDIKASFSNQEIFQIFSENKRILLYLIEEKIMTIDKKLFEVLTKNLPNEIYTKDKYIVGNYHKYFFPEIKQFLDKCYINKIMKDIPEDFLEKRKIGENDSYICELIRKDLIDDFITYINKTNYQIKKKSQNSFIRLIPLNLDMDANNENDTITSSQCTKINESIFETNHFLIRNYYVTLIEYACFFGSVQIFKYLYKNGIELTTSLWDYAVHGNNAEIIHILEEHNLKPNEKSLIESIKCHHSDITTYIQNNYQLNISFNFQKKCLKYYNFLCIENEQINNSLFFDLCKYNYITLVEIFLKMNHFDINKSIIDGKNELKPLHISIEKENLEIIQLLISDNHIDVNSKSIITFTNEELYVHEDITEEKTPLRLAIEKNNLRIVKTLLSNEQIDVNLKCKTYYEKEKDNTYLEKSPLFIAVEKGNVEIVKQLLSKEKIDVNSINKFIVNSTIKGVMMENAWKWWLVDEKFKWSEWSDDEGLEEGQVDDDENLYMWNDDYEETALHLAVEKGNLEIVQLLLSSPKLDINIKAKKFSHMNPINPITMKEENEDFGYCYYEDSEKNALCIAIEKENVEIVQQLLSFENIDVNDKCKIKSNNEKSPLHLTVLKNNIEIINLLLKNKGINVNIIDEKGKKPIDYTKNEQIIQLLHK